MKRVRVIAPEGAVVRGPAKVKLSKKQHAARAGLLGPWKKGGLFALDAGQALQFKRGESFAIDATGRLNPLLFEPSDDGRADGHRGASDAEDPGSGTDQG